MARLPIVGGDTGTWGAVLNDFLQVAHHEDGTLRGTREVFNVRDFGAIGDGSSHPLSEFYPSLAAAQVVYPHAISLTDEIDWAAIQAALHNAAGTVFIPAGEYIIDRTLSINKSYNVQIVGQGRDHMHGGGAVLVCDFPSPMVLLDLAGFRWQRIADLAIVVREGAAAVPSTFIDVKNDAPKLAHYWQAERVRIVGRSKTDGNTAISLGQGDDAQGDNVSFRDVEIQHVGAGIVFRHNQAVGYELSKLHFNTVGACLVFADDPVAPTGVGGGMVFGSSIQHTSTDGGHDETVVFIRTTGGHTCFTFANLTTEWDAILVDASTATAQSGQIVVNVVGGRSSRTDRTRPIMMVGPGVVLNCVGGLFRTTPGVDEFDVQGDRDNGDAVLNLSGCYIGNLGGFSIRSNRHGFYRVESCIRWVNSTSGLVDQILVQRWSAQEYVPDEYKTPMAPIGHIKFPIHGNNLGGTFQVRRYLPPETLITRIIVNITETEAPSGHFELRIPMLAARVQVIDATVPGYRELRLLDSQLQPGDDAINLAHPDFDLGAGSIGIMRTSDDCLLAQGYCIVEYAYRSAGVDFDIAPFESASLGK